MRTPAEYLDAEKLGEMGALIPSPALNAIVRAMILFAEDYSNRKPEDMVEEQMASRKETTLLNNDEE